MSARLLRASAALAIVCFPQASAFGQSATAWIPQEAPSEPPPDAGPIDRFGRLGSQHVEITAGTKGSSASVALEIANWSVDPANPSGADAFRRSNDTVNLIVSTPLGDGEDEAQIANLDGLANGTKLTLRFGRWSAYLPRDVPSAAMAIYERAQERCRQVAASRDVVRRTALGEDPSVAAVTQADEQRQNDMNECANPAGGSQNQIATYLPSWERRYINAFVPSDARHYGFELSVNRRRFEFVDPTTIADGAERHVQWSAKAFYTQYLRESVTAVTFSAGYERSYKAARSAVFCPANPNNVVIRCTNASAGPPTLNEGLILSAGLRHQLADRGILRNVAIAPQVTYDVLDETVGFDLPVYFLPNADGGLTGGIRFGYQSDRDNEFSVGIFIGAAFNILN